MVSECAQKEYEKRHRELKLDLSLNLAHLNWEHQPQFDKGRKTFNLDHIFTGGMFRKALKRLLEADNLNIESISELVQENYRMAWILKEEERRLPRSERGDNLQSALNIYHTNDIAILGRNT